MYLVAQKGPKRRQTQVQLLKQLQPNEQIMECENWDCTLMEMIQGGNVDFLFLDTNVMEFSWLSRCKDLLKTLNNTRMILTSQSIEHNTLYKLFEDGLWSFIPHKDITRIGKPIFNLILTGGRYLPVSSFMDNKSELTNNENIGEKLLPTGEKLTKRQKEVLNYLQEGLSNKQIAGKMNISEPTVKLHIHGLFHKLHAINRTQIVLKAAELGLN